eukprot:5840812-Pyramimonas_sp.AAC.1
MSSIIYKILSGPSCREGPRAVCGPPYYIAKRRLDQEEGEPGRHGLQGTRRRAQVAAGRTGLRASLRGWLG